MGTEGRSNDAASLEGRHDLLEELRRQVVAIRERREGDGRGMRMRMVGGGHRLFAPDEVHERTEAVFGAPGESHLVIMDRSPTFEVGIPHRRR